MPCIVRALYADGTLSSLDYEGETLSETAKFEPKDGVYTITNTYFQTRVLKIDAHLDRLEDSANRSGVALSLNRQQLRHALRQMILEANWGDVRFRVTASNAYPNALILSIEPFKPLSADVFEQGVHCMSVPDSARHNPEAKTTDWMHQRTTLEKAMPKGIYETFLRDANDTLLEGLSSNFYAILGDTLYTADSGVLYGISRQIVLEVAPKVVAVQREGISYSQVPHLSEAFLSSSSRGIVPIVTIDGVTIGTGKVGTRTKALREAYIQWMRSHLEEL